MSGGSLKWKPISSAPSDGTTVYVWAHGWPYPLPAYYDEYISDWHPDSYLLRGAGDVDIAWSWRAGIPTHWKEIEVVSP